MSKTTWVLIAVLVLALCPARPARAQSDADGSRFRRAKRISRPVTVTPSDGDDPDQPDGDPAASRSVSPQPFSRPAPGSPGVIKPRGEPTSSDPKRPDAIAISAADDESENAEEEDEDTVPLSTRAPPRTQQAAPRSNPSRDVQRPERYATINRAELATQSARRKPTTYLSQFEDEQGINSEAVGAQPGGQEPLAAESLQSLQEQIAELKAQLDSLTAAQAAAQAPGSGEPSTVQGSVFGPDANQPTGTMQTPPSAPEIPSTVLGSVFGTSATAGTHSWVNDGLTFVSRDGAFRTHLGGLVQLDYIAFARHLSGITSIPGGAGADESVTFRRLRVRADGTMYSFIDWVAEFDFAFSLQNTDQRDAAAAPTGLRSFPTGVGVQGGNTINVIQPTTTFLTFKEIPLLGNVRVGNQQDWFSLEHIESARFLDFMERSPLMDVFSGPNNNGYTPGISAFNNTPDKNAGAQIGIYHNNAYDSGFTFDIGDAWTYGGRVIWTPYYDEESKGRYMVHLGLGSQYRSFNKNVGATQGFANVRLRSRGDLRNASSTLDPNYSDTGNFFAIGQSAIGPEVAVQLGPFLFQSEYVGSWFYGAKPAKNVNTSLGSVFFQGYYAQVLFFLTTDDNRDYNRQQGVFNRVVPKHNWDRKGNWGAWQAAVRYDFVDLNSGTLLNGGNSSDMTFGLNWFLNANARFQFNYVLSWVNNAPPVTFPGTLGALNGSRFVGDGTINSFGARMDFNW